jgi:hypothetical protein
VTRLDAELLVATIAIALVVIYAAGVTLTIAAAVLP